MRRRTWVSAAIGIAIVASGCSRPQTTEPSSGASPIAVGDRAPAFGLKSAGGSTVSLSDFAGKPVLLYFSMGPG